MQRILSLETSRSASTTSEFVSKRFCFSILFSIAFLFLLAVGDSVVMLFVGSSGRATIPLGLNDDDPVGNRLPSRKIHNRQGDFTQENLPSAKIRFRREELRRVNEKHLDLVEEHQQFHRHRPIGRDGYSGRLQ
ncbi:l-asparaginase [Holotrichia oblita]|uniref:L-asparaginase n=1 Tax=Holotrichia oblita TaxID=644536 RepID=A0ACB9TQN2_HOLOL|nr:l-asparaginase [Holotrichia oblita]